MDIYLFTGENIKFPCVRIEALTAFVNHEMNGTASLRIFVSTTAIMTVPLDRVSYFAHSVKVN